MKFIILFISFLIITSSAFSSVNPERKQDAGELTGHRFLTFNTVIRVNQIEVARDKNVGRDERDVHTPEKVIKFREAIEMGFPGSRITWAFSWLASFFLLVNQNKRILLIRGKWVLPLFTNLKKTIF